MSEPVGDATARLPIVILISGRGSNMQAIVERSASGALPVEVRAVVSDQPAAPGLTVAANLGIKTVGLPARGFPDRAAYDAALSALIAHDQPALVVLAGFMRILTPSFIAAWRDRIVNIHPSLLPRHRGLHTHRRVLEAGDPEHGASVHFVTEELDGGPLIVQSRIAVEPGDTETSLSARVQRLEHRIYPEAIGWYARGRLELRAGRAWLDGRPFEAPVSMQIAGD